jgi:hypothetical protein
MFHQQNSIRELEKTITVIMEYWKRCIAQNNFIWDLSFRSSIGFSIQPV